MINYEIITTEKSSFSKGIEIKPKSTERSEMFAPTLTKDGMIITEYIKGKIDYRNICENNSSNILSKISAEIQKELNKKKEVTCEVIVKYYITLEEIT